METLDLAMYNEMILRERGLVLSFKKSVMISNEIIVIGLANFNDLYPIIMKEIRGKELALNLVTSLDQWKSTKERMDKDFPGHSTSFCVMLGKEFLEFRIKKMKDVDMEPISRFMESFKDPIYQEDSEVLDMVNSI